MAPIWANFELEFDISREFFLCNWCIQRVLCSTAGTLLAEDVSVVWPKAGQPVTFCIGEAWSPWYCFIEKSSVAT